jgi:hypothetical protein
VEKPGERLGSRGCAHPTMPIENTWKKRRMAPMTPMAGSSPKQDVGVVFTALMSWECPELGILDTLSVP